MGASPDVLSALLAAVDAVNEQLASGERLLRSGEARITGPSAQLDSLHLVSFLIAAEEQLEAAFGEPVRLMDALLGDDTRGELPSTLVELADAVSQRIVGGLGGDRSR